MNKEIRLNGTPLAAPDISQANSVIEQHIGADANMQPSPIIEVAPVVAVFGALVLAGAWFNAKIDRQK